MKTCLRFLGSAIVFALGLGVIALLLPEREESPAAEPVAAHVAEAEDAVAAVGLQDIWELAPVERAVVDEPAVLVEEPDPPLRSGKDLWEEEEVVREVTEFEWYEQTKWDPTFDTFFPRMRDVFRAFREVEVPEGDEDWIAGKGSPELSEANIARTLVEGWKYEGVQEAWDRAQELRAERHWHVSKKGKDPKNFLGLFYEQQSETLKIFQALGYEEEFLRQRTREE